MYLSESKGHVLLQLALSNFFPRASLPTVYNTNETKWKTTHPISNVYVIK